MTTIQRYTLLLSSKGDPSEQINKADELITELEKEMSNSFVGIDQLRKRIDRLRKTLDKRAAAIQKLGLMKHRINLNVIGWKEKF